MIDNAFKLSYMIGLVTGSIIRRYYALYGKKKATKELYTKRADTFLLAFVAVGMILLPLMYLFGSRLDFADYHPPEVVGIAGIIVFASAIWLLWRSHYDLGHNWSPLLEIRKEHTLVTGGVYKYIRHPIYAAHWLWALGQALLLHNWIAGLGMLVTFIPLYLQRVGREEKMMLDNFGDEYHSYMQRTGRLLPRFK